MVKFRAADDWLYTGDKAGDDADTADGNYIRQANTKGITQYSTGNPGGAATYGRGMIDYAALKIGNDRAEEKIHPALVARYRGLKMSAIKDGASNTFLIVEKSLRYSSYDTDEVGVEDNGGYASGSCPDNVVLGWLHQSGNYETHDNTTWPFPVVQDGENTPVEMAGSAHSAGLNCLHGDGRVVYVPDDVDVLIWRYKSDPRDRQHVNATF